MKRTLALLVLAVVVCFFHSSDAAQILSETYFDTPDFCVNYNSTQHSKLIWTGEGYRAVWNDTTDYSIKTAVFNEYGGLIQGPVTIMDNVGINGAILSALYLKLVGMNTGYGLLWLDTWVKNGYIYQKLRITIFDESDNKIAEKLISSYADVVYDAIWDGKNFYVVWKEESIRPDESLPKADQHSCVKFARFCLYNGKIYRIYTKNPSTGALEWSKILVPYQTGIGDISIANVGTRFGLAVEMDNDIYVYALNKKGEIVKNKVFPGSYIKPRLISKGSHFLLGVINTGVTNWEYHFLELNTWLQILDTAIQDSFSVIDNPDFLYDGTHLVLLWRDFGPQGQGVYVAVYDEGLELIEGPEYLISIYGGDKFYSLTKGNECLAFINELEGTGEYSDLYLIRFSNSSGSY